MKVADGNPAAQGQLDLQCLLDPKEDPGRTTLASYTARCERVASDALLEQVLELHGHGERQCGTGVNGSTGSVRSVWTSALSLPGDAAHTVAVTTSGPTDSPPGPCAVTVGDKTVIAGASSTVEVAGVAGTVPVKIDCYRDGSASLVFASCYGFDPANPPPVDAVHVDRNLSVDLRVR